MSDEQSEQQAFHVGDVFKSNDGAGPWTATLIRIEGETAVLDRSLKGGKEVYTFRLPLTFLSSPACGWRPLGAGIKPKPKPPAAPSSYEVECGDMRVTIMDASDEKDAAAKAMQRTEVEGFGVLLRVRRRPHGEWVYLDATALEGSCEGS